MELKFIDNPVRLQAFLNDPGNTENIVELGHTYYIKPDAVYLGIYEGLCWLAFMKCVTSGIALLNAMRCTTPDSVVNMHCKGIDYSANGSRKLTIP